MQHLARKSFIQSKNAYHPSRRQVNRVRHPRQVHLLSIHLPTACRFTFGSAMLEDNKVNHSVPCQAVGDVLQYVVVRRDLYTVLKWPLGSVIAQACHAATAALWESRDEPLSIEYCSPEHINEMHKVVLEVNDEAQLKKLSEKLLASNIRHKLWMEQPENIPTSLALAPYRKTEVHQYVKRLKLCKS